MGNVTFSFTMPPTALREGIRRSPSLMHQPSLDEPRPPCRVVGIPYKTNGKCNIPGDLHPPPVGWRGERPACCFRSSRWLRTCSQRQLVIFHCWPIPTVIIHQTPSDRFPKGSPWPASKVLLCISIPGAQVRWFPTIQWDFQAVDFPSRGISKAYFSRRLIIHQTSGF